MRPPDQAISLLVCALGGEGIERDLLLLEDVTVSLITERRVSQPWGLAGLWNTVLLSLLVVPLVEPDWRFDPDLLGGTVVLTGDAKILTDVDWGPDLYRSHPPKQRTGRFHAIPYHLWANRAPGSMQVWIRETEIAAAFL